MKQVEFLETVRIGEIEFNKEDRKSFPDTEASEYVRLGWAKDMETGETNERVPGAQPMRVDNIRQKAV